MTKPSRTQLLIFTIACAAAAGCDNRHLVGDTNGAAGTSGSAGTTGAAGTGSSGGAGTTASGFAGTSGFGGTSGGAGTTASGFAGTSGFGGTSGGAGTGAMGGASGFAGTSGAAGTGSGFAPEPEFTLPITARDALRRATRVLWGGASDAAVIVGTPRTNRELTASVSQLFADGRARIGLGAFYRWWLGLDDLAGATKDPTLYPEFTADLRRSMAAETETFGVNVTLDGDGQFWTLMNAPFSYIDENLASIYGVAGVTGTALRKVALDPTVRAGILTQPAVMAVTSLATRTSPTLRGALVSNQVLCRLVPAPPPNTPALAPTFPPMKTTRQALQDLVSQNAACAACHRLTDDLGYLFEGLDAIGRTRTTDNGSPVDTSGGFMNNDGPPPGYVVLGGPVELAGVLGSNSEAARCFVQQWMTFALGRSLTEADQPSFDYAQGTFANSGLEMRAMIAAVLTSRAFLAP